jgi:hypothetical protein
LKVKAKKEPKSKHGMYDPVKEIYVKKRIWDKPYPPAPKVEVVKKVAAGDAKTAEKKYETTCTQTTAMKRVGTQTKSC